MRTITKKTILLGSLASHLALLAVLCFLDVPRFVYHRLRPKALMAPGETERYHFGILYHSRMDDTVPDHSVIFVGDSFTAGLCTDAVAMPSVNYGIGSDTTVGVLKRLPRYRSMSRASAIVYEIGANDVDSRSDLEIERNIEMIIDATPKGPKLLLCAVMPTAGGGGLVERIAQLNTRLRYLSEKKRIGFIDPTPSLCGPDGFLLHQYDDGDGLHLNSQGNKVWIKALREALHNLLL